MLRKFTKIINDYWSTTVSILVVMESAQEEYDEGLYNVQAVGFNPCCNGKCSGRIDALIQNAKKKTFQSLL